MRTATDAVRRLTEAVLPAVERRRALNAFAVENGWYPSEAIEDYPGVTSFSSGHLLVEHGMTNSAVITFLSDRAQFGDLPRRDQNRVLGLSYNNLVDWHLFPDRYGLTVVHNREAGSGGTRLDDTDAWRADAFESVTEEGFSPQLKPVDDALVATLSFWKRAIGSEMGAVASNENIAAFFNTIIMLRALEDHRHSLGQATGRELITAAMSSREGDTTTAVLIKALRRHGPRQFPAIFRAQAAGAAVFDDLDPSTREQLIGDFYTSRYAPYAYDFSVISKHALSRIYEHYASLLRTDDSDQLRFFPDLAEEVTNKNLGSYYTPQFIARFFARYVREHTAPRRFRELRVIDPACGSGIFLRNFLEMQCEAPFDPIATADLKGAFRRTTGIDIDASACEATRLSLSLLHLVLTGGFPRSLDVRNRDVIEVMNEGVDLRAAFDVVVSNPPYVKWDALPPEVRSRLSVYMAEYGKGKVDLYLGVLKAGLEMVRPGGWMLCVLPHTFLHGKSSDRVRDEISEQFWVRLIADLSDIEVFGDVGSYTTLLILERKTTSNERAPRASVVRCRDFVGAALQAALQGKHVDNDAHQVFEVDQTTFEAKTWRLLGPAEQSLDDRLAQFPPLSSFTTVRTGIVTGADKVFIRPHDETPEAENGVWRPLLADREMVPYCVPDAVSNAVFYPYEGSRKLKEHEVREGYPATWAYLSANADALTSRKTVTSGRVPWWSPAWPRPPEHLLRPKIICPHLMLLPRFSLDVAGRYAVTRAPLIYPTGDAAGEDLLLYLLGVLNSALGHWQIRTQSHKYSRGYAMIEPKTLKDFRLPDPSQVPPRELRRLIKLVRKRMASGYSPELEIAISDSVADLFGLGASERAVVEA